MVTKLVSELGRGLLLQTNAHLKRQVYCPNTPSAVDLRDGYDGGRQRIPAAPSLWFHVIIDEAYAPAYADAIGGSDKCSERARDE
jgi:hypothetical protein